MYQTGKKPFGIQEVVAGIQDMYFNRLQFGGKQA